MVDVRVQLHDWAATREEMERRRERDLRMAVCMIIVREERIQNAIRVPVNVRGLTPRGECPLKYESV